MKLTYLKTNRFYLYDYASVNLITPFELYCIFLVQCQSEDYFSFLELNADDVSLNLGDSYPMTTLS